MGKTFFKNVIRDIKKTFSRFLSIVIIIAVGVSFYAGVRASSPDMKTSGDAYFSKNSLMDFKLISTLGLTKDDLAEAAKIKGVTKVEGAYSLDAVIEKDKHSLVLNIDSLPEVNGINNIEIVSGRRPEKADEAVVEDRFLKEYNLKTGDKITIKSGNDTNIGDSLKNTEFVITGTALSPLYSSEQRQLSSVGNGSVRGFVYILPEVFKNDVYTEIYVKTDNDLSANSLQKNDNYKKSAGEIETALKDLGVKRNESRYAEVLKAANDKIKEAEDKLNSSRQEAESKIADGWKQLETAKADLAKGNTDLENSEKLYNKKITDGEKAIADGKSQLASAENQLNSKATEIEKGKTQISDGKKQLDESAAKLDAGKQKAYSSISQAMASKLSDAKLLMDANPGNALYAAQYNALNQIYTNDIAGKDFDSMYSSLQKDGALDQINSIYDIKTLKGNFDKSAAELAAGRQQLASKEKALQDGETQLAAGRTQLEENKKKLTDSEAQLAQGKKDGLAKLNDGKQKLAAGQKEIDDNSAKLKSEEENMNSQFSSAAAEIQKNKDKISEIKKPDWYVLGRSANVGYESYRQDSDRIDNIGKAFPLIFFLVAALVSLTTMTRMVQENRTEIGTFKALGYSRRSIITHYLIYSLSASLIGSLIGISFGFKLFPPLIMSAYSSLYSIPDSLKPFNVSLALQASLIAVVFVTAAAVASTMEELREVPASLMRPKAPKSGKVILLEKITVIWKRLSFTKKVTARNIFRYKQRLLMTVIGIAACTSLMITAFGLKSGIVGATEKQFSDIYRYDMSATLSKSIDSAKKDETKASIMKDSNITSVLFTYTKNGSVKNTDGLSEDAYVVVPENKENINKYINLTMNGKALALGDDGVIITEKFSRLINKKAGNTIEITINDKTVRAKIASVTEQYVQHYIYMSPAYYQKLTGEAMQYNSLYGLLKNTSDSAENITSKTVTGISGIGSVNFKRNMQIDMGKSIKSINSVVLVLIASAGVLAFVVIYNLTNINVNERRRELATIKLLGFFNHELALYIYRENIILTVIGSFTGIVMGILLNRFIISSAETNIMMFLRTVDPIYFLYSVLLTLAFSVIVNIAMYGKFDRIDMIESLKNAE